MKTLVLQLDKKANIVIGGCDYSTERDLKQAMKDIKRVLRILSEKSVGDIIRCLAPYRQKFADNEDKFVIEETNGKELTDKEKN